MENLVAIHLLRKNQNKGVYFVKGEDYEVDFLDEEKRGVNTGNLR